MARSEWSRDEVELIVGDYFAMLRSELLDEPYNKAEHRRALGGRLDNRSKSAIEFKHQNVSAVLVQLGLPYIKGYKPMGNFQALLTDGVKDYLNANPGLLEGLAEAPLVDPDRAPSGEAASFDDLQEDPPERIVAPYEPAKPWMTRKPVRIDFAARDAANRRLSKLGETWVVELERRRLVKSGRDDLAGKVEWVAETIGDGLGFDVLSFDEESGSERLIEVKTTGLGKYFPFYVSGNEVRCSEDIEERFHLYRVFNFARGPKLFVLQGSLKITCRLEAVQYRAMI